MDDITAILERFNRKERNLLVRDLLDCQPGVTPLSKNFCERVTTALGIQIPQTAWWATDYHLNWIAAALALWRDGGKAVGTSHANTRAGTPLRGLIERNQEDADLLIAFNRTLVLIEVKAFGYFTNKQIDSKVQRWRMLKAYFDAGIPADRKLNLYFMLMSRTKPTGLTQTLDGLMPGYTELPHAVLKLRSPSQRLKVTGRNPTAGSPAPDDHTWFIVPVPDNEEEPKDDRPV
jgi:hypothetical protein